MYNKCIAVSAAFLIISNKLKKHKGIHCIVLYQIDFIFLAVGFN